MTFFSWLKSLFTPKDDSEFLADPWPSNIVLVHIGNLVDLPPYAREVILNAIKEWSDKSELGILITEDFTLAQIKIYSKDLSGRPAGYAYFPSNYHLAGHVQLDNSDREWTRSLLSAVAKHEIGHALGLKHNPYKSSIMYFSINGRKTMSHWDIKRLNKLYENTHT